MGYTTFQDVIDHALDYLGGNPQDAALRDCKRATLEAYRTLANAHNWSYLYTHGRIITSGIGLNDYDLILGGALLVTALALGVDGLFALAQRATATRGLTDSTTAPHRSSASRSSRPPTRENA